MILVADERFDHTIEELKKVRSALAATTAELDRLPTTVQTDNTRRLVKKGHEHLARLAVHLRERGIDPDA